MEKSQLLPQSSQDFSFPPPYEAPAYPRDRRRRRVFIKSLLSIRTVLSLVATTSILYLCFLLSGPAPLTNDHVTFDLASETARSLLHFDEAVEQCAALQNVIARSQSKTREENPRWNSKNGQQQRVVLRNAKLFDGEAWSSSKVDITFSKGIVESITDSIEGLQVADAVEHDLQGRFVSPGLVDMHSHHMAGLWPMTEATSDGNEINDNTKEITSMMRVLDALKAYDQATTLICSGGVTTSLIIPGSANIIGGEGAAVKNMLYSGVNGEPVVEEVLLEHGLPAEQRRRYMKMAFGENPTRLWHHTRMGVAWDLRSHLQKAKDVKESQDDYCSVLAKSGEWEDSKRHAWIESRGKYPSNLELESTVALLRGQIILQNHNYEPEDMETMLRISHEFGYRVWGFHHATEAWQVPEMLKSLGDNVTIATFAEFSGYKWEAYSPNLYAGKILNDHGVPVAYKSDHSIELTNAKYLLSQAAVAHAFALPEDKALQAVTSVPAKAIDQHHRVGYCRPGYDADIVVWNYHPLSIGATPVQVFVDGVPQLDQEKVEESMGTTFTSNRVETTQDIPQMRFEPEDVVREQTCAGASSSGQSFIIRGVQKAFARNYPHLMEAPMAASAEEPLEVIINNGDVTCIGSASDCAVHSDVIRAAGQPVEITLKNGHLTPGFTGMTAALGMREVSTLDNTGDGDAKGQKIGDADSVTYAKYGIWLDGKQFSRARLGGVTRAITPPFGASSGLVQGVSVEIITSGKKSLADGGIIQGDVALHLNLGDDTKSSEHTVSNGIKNLRKMLKDGQGKNNETVYGEVAAGKLPMIVHCNNQVSDRRLLSI